MNGSQDDQTTPPVEPNAATAQEPAAQQAPPAAQVPPAGRFFQMSPGVAQDPRAKSPALACFLSIMPGLGQVYTGYYVRGFVFAITVASIITILAGTRVSNFVPFLAIFMAFFWLHNIIDAGRRAAFYNRMLAGGTNADEFLPEMKMPGVGGSMFAGLGLMVVGLIALTYTKFDMSLDWIEDWWPVIPFIIGAYLFGLAVRDRKKKDA